MPIEFKELHDYAAVEEGWFDFYYCQPPMNQVLGPHLNTYM